MLNEVSKSDLGFCAPAESHLPLRVRYTEEALTRPEIRKEIDRLLTVASLQPTQGELKREGVIVDGRSLILPLEHPLEIRGESYAALKVKGVTNHGRPPELTLYTGDGISVQQPGAVLACEAGKFFIRDPLPRAKGYMRLASAENEHRMSDVLPRIGIATNLSLGAGAVEGHQLQDIQMGVVVLALREVHAKRLNEIPPMRGFRDDFIEAAASLGRLHAAELIHKNPHPGNFALRPGGGVELVDLEDAKSTEGLDESAKLVWRAKDICCFALNLQTVVLKHQGIFTRDRAKARDFAREAFVEGYSKGRRAEPEIRDSLQRAATGVAFHSLGRMFQVRELKTDGISVPDFAGILASTRLGKVLSEI